MCALRSCPKCHGDLVLDGDEWRCWQCGQYYYPKRPNMDVPPESKNGDVFDTRRRANRNGLAAAGQRLQRAARAARDINSIIAAKQRSERRWWLKNREIIRHLDAGRSVREIALLINRGQRQIRVVRERLNDLRAVKGEEPPQE